jgi:hypothetical protein
VQVAWPLEDPRLLFVRSDRRFLGRLGFQPFVEAEHEKPASSHRDFVALPQARRRHFVAVDHHVLGIRGRFYPKPAFLPADPPLHRKNPFPGENDIAGRPTAEEHGVIAR